MPCSAEPLLESILGLGLMLFVDLQAEGDARGHRSTAGARGHRDREEPRQGGGGRHGCQGGCHGCPQRLPLPFPGAASSSAAACSFRVQLSLQPCIGSSHQCMPGWPCAAQGSAMAIHMGYHMLHLARKNLSSMQSKTKNSSLHCICLLGSATPRGRRPTAHSSSDEALMISDGTTVQGSSEAAAGAGRLEAAGAEDCRVAGRRLRWAEPRPALRAGPGSLCRRPAAGAGRH